ncbi:MAG: Manganese transport system membrane protein MntB [Chlamydiae bacterium]|nr:Manganese transport system membrane protein MntB [Chlamydiota bacterium]
MTPYHGADFFQFFALFFSRLFAFNTLASDEIQVFVLSLIAIASSLVGALLVLKKMTMLANSLSHTILLGIVIAYILLFKTGSGMSINFQVLIIAALVTGIVTTLLTQILHRVIKLQEDASIGIVFTSLFALGILLVTLYTRNAHIGLEVVMGNADALHFDDLKVALGVAATNILIVTLFFKEWKLICFDQGLAASLGFRPSLYNYLLMLLTSATAISAFRAVGVLLFLAFLVGPPLTARLLTSNLRKLLFLSCSIGILSSLLAVGMARHLLTMFNLPLSTAGLVVTFIGVFFLLGVAVKLLRTSPPIRSKSI